MATKEKDNLVRTSSIAKVTQRKAAKAHKATVDGSNGTAKKIAQKMQGMADSRMKIANKAFNDRLKGNSSHNSAHQSGGRSR